MTAKGGLFRLSSDRAAAVSTEVYWWRVDAVTPPERVKLLLFNERNGVAVLGWYEPNGQWTHWHPLPYLVKETEL